MFERLKSELFPPADEFDVKRGVRTSGVKSLFWRRIASGRRKDTVRYQPVNESFFQEAVRCTPRNWTFVDLGCGKGRALILASEAGFQDLIGVDFSPTLCGAARRNLAKLEIKATILCTDATKYRLPELPCVLYLYNPFGPRILEKVLENLGSAPRIVVYINPVHESSFHSFQPAQSGDNFRIYLSNCSGLPALSH